MVCDYIHLFSVFDRSITRSYYRNSVGALILYDITKRSSFNHIEEWITEAKLHIAPHEAVFVVVAHKCDQEDERKVSSREGKQFADYHGLKYLETSAKTGQNVEEAFLTVAKDIYKLLEDGKVDIEEGWDGIKPGFTRPRESFSLMEGETEGGGCC